MPVIKPVPYWSNEQVTIYLGDCLKVMNRLADLGGGFAHLAFADPPFNIGYRYEDYDDSLKKEVYLVWCGSWMRQVKRCLRPDGSFYLACHLSYMAELKIEAERAGFAWRDTVAWHYTFGPRQEKKYTPSWVPIHYFTAGDRWYFDGDAVRVPSARTLKYNDARARRGGKVPDNVWVLLPNEYSDCFVGGQNAFLESRVAGTFSERVNHPCQMPEAVLRRIIRASCPEGGVVLDSFLGSGTTAVAAVKEGRRCVGVELNANYIDGCCVPRLGEP